MPTMRVREGRRLVMVLALVASGCSAGASPGTPPASPADGGGWTRTVLPTSGDPTVDRAAVQMVLVLHDETWMAIGGGMTDRPLGSNTVATDDVAVIWTGGPDRDWVRAAPEGLGAGDRVAQAAALGPAAVLWGFRDLEPAAWIVRDGLATDLYLPGSPRAMASDEDGVLLVTRGGPASLAFTRVGPTGRREPDVPVEDPLLLIDGILPADGSVLSYGINIRRKRSTLARLSPGDGGVTARTDLEGAFVSGMAAVPASDLLIATGSVQDHSYAMWTSDDGGTTWSLSTSAPDVGLAPVVTGRSVLYALSTDGRPWWSTDGLSWAPLDDLALAGFSPNALAVDGDTLIVGGSVIVGGDPVPAVVTYTPPA